MIVWDDIDGLNENNKYNKNKISHNKNKFHFNPSNEDYGLDDKITIKPFNIRFEAIV